MIDATTTAGARDDELAATLGATAFIDCDHPAIVAHTAKVVGELDGVDASSRAAALFYAVRDGITYDPYSVSLDPARFKASAVLEAGRGFCVNKAVLLAALGRAAGLPTRLGFADVRNHLASPRLLERMGTDVFAFHGYNELLIDGRWVKVTAAFDRRLCERFDVAPLDFDGRTDAVLQPYNAKGAAYMEYIRDHGHFDDLPFDEMVASFQTHYPHFFDGGRPPDRR